VRSTISLTIWNFYGIITKRYDTTAVPLSQDRDGNLFSPEVLVKGSISPENIRIYNGK